tara:strand:+ start:684 stop:1619 length:936 start_codon:yes stop_codon:yes gene_type:complete
MKVAFFSEIGNNQKYPRTFPNARTEVAWCLALEAPMCSLTPSQKERIDDDFDLGIVIIPKNNPELIDWEWVRSKCDKVAVMQEGPHWYFQDYDINNQFNYYNALMEADRVYCHNESDVSYYLGLGCKDVRVMRSLMIPAGISSRGDDEIGNGGIILGGNFVSWYGGFDSYIVSREFGLKLSAPSMGRKQEQESLIEDINYLPYMNWRLWITGLAQYKFGVHLMRTHAAGTFSMNLAYHGIPCVGYKGLDTQEILHPLTTVEIGDLEKAKDIVGKLTNDRDFYKLCRNTIRKRFINNYSEKAWKENWKELHR